jgi:hypothetical protein
MRMSAYETLKTVGLRALPDSTALWLLHWKRVGRRPNLRNPRSFNEKIQARKLRNRDPRLPLFADKVKVKEHVTKVLGESWVTPTLWSGSTLPERGARDWPVPFVIKSSHGSGHTIFVRDPQAIDWDAIETKTRSWVADSFGDVAREWLYTRIERQILVEPFIGSGDSAPLDFKFHVFGGRVEYIQVDVDRFSDHRRAFYDRDWQRTDVELIYKMATTPIARPAALSEMMRGAELLAADFGYVRVDLYDLDGEPRFGEMTFYPESGFGRFSPDQADFALGALWTKDD